MIKWTSSKRVSAATIVAAMCGLAGSLGASAQSAPHAAGPSLLDKAVRAEADLHVEGAMASLYELITEHPRDPDVVKARLRLARLLAFTGNYAAGILQAQAVKAEPLADEPSLRAASNLATLLARRFRAGLTSGNYFTSTSPVDLPAVGALDEPGQIEFNAGGDYLLVDGGNGHAFRVAGGTPTALTGPDVTAATFASDGRVLVANKNGVSLGGATAAPWNGTWGGKARPVRRVRSAAPLSTGELLVIDRDYDGILTCKADGTCTPWGPPGKARTIRVGASDIVHVVDDNGQRVRILDRAGKALASIGPVLGTAKIGEIADLAVDAAYGVYLLDKSTKRVEILTLRAGAGDVVTTAAMGGMTLLDETDKPLRNASALGAAPDGGLLVASKPRIVKWQ
jgi:hypothetical protein